MMALKAVNRWALTFADLSLLMLALIVLLNLHQPLQQTSAASSKTLMTQTREIEIPSTDLFDAGEAMVSPEGLVEIESLTSEILLKNEHVEISIAGLEEGSVRLDNWELAAARVASIARLIRSRGLNEDSLSLGDIALKKNSDGQEIIFRLEATN